ncbi:MAG: hypothetical protein V4760_05025 [Bdellovibrionota bacterium]
MRVGDGIESNQRQSVGIFLRLVVAFTVLVAVAPQAFAQDTKATLSTNVPSKKKNVKASWNLEVSGEGYSDEQQQAQTTGLGLNGKIDYKFLPSLELKAAAGVSMQSGYAQSRFGDNTPASGVSLKEAVIVVKPIDRMSISAGAIDQGHLNSPLLVSSQPFPGVKERVLLGSRAFNVEVKAQQTIPTSKSLSTKAIEAEVTPSFTTETLALRSEAIPNVKLLVYGTHFAFRSLPSTVAIESERYGNTVTPISANRSRFKYEFDGYVAGGESKVAVTRSLEWNVAGQMLQNTKADQSFASGQTISTGLEIALAGDVNIAPEVGSFFSESDVAPGFYNDSVYGHNNRTGWYAKIDATFKNAGFKAGLDYVDSDLINPSTLQSRMSFIRIRFETLYDVL